MGGAMLSKSLIQFSVDGWSCVPCLLFDLRPNYGGGNEDNVHLLQKVLCTHCCTQCPRHCSRPLLAHTSTGDTVLAQSLWGVWVLMCTRFCLCPPRVCFPVLCKFWQLYGGLTATSKRAYAIPRSTAPRAPASAAVHC